MHVARRTHARDIKLVEGAMYAINPDPAFIPPTSNDESLPAALRTACGSRILRRRGPR